MDRVEPDWLLDQLTLRDRIRSGNPDLIPNRIQRAAMFACELVRGPRAMSRKAAVRKAQQSYSEFTIEQIEDQLTQFETN